MLLSIFPIYKVCTRPTHLCSQTYAKSLHTCHAPYWQPPIGSHPTAEHWLKWFVCKFMFEILTQLLPEEHSHSKQKGRKERQTLPWKKREQKKGKTRKKDRIYRFVHTLAKHNSHISYFSGNTYLNSTFFSADFLKMYVYVYIYSRYCNWKLLYKRLKPNRKQYSNKSSPIKMKSEKYSVILTFCPSGLVH